MEKRVESIFKVFIIIVLTISALFAISLMNGFSGVVTRTTKCYDTDLTKQFSNGRNYFNKGIVSGTDSFGKSFSYSDICSGNYLREFWCDKNGMRFEYKNILRSELHFCPNGCKNGVCLQKF